MTIKWLEHRKIVESMERLDEALKKIDTKISINFKIAFISTVIIGLVAHLYMFTNKFPNYDDMGLNSFGATFRLGRWFLWVLGAVAYHLDYVYSIPLVNGLITIVLLAVSAGMIADLLQLKNNIATVIVAGILVVFPSWTATFFFMYTAPYYAVAVFLMTLSAYFYYKYQYGYLFAGFCIALSMGIYQAYLPFGATLYVVLLILEVYKEDTEWVELLKKALKNLFVLVIGVVVYYLIMKISLVVTNQQLADYKGTGQMGNISLSLIPQMISKMFIDGFGVMFNNNLEISHNLVLKAGYAALYLADVIAAIVSCGYFIKKKKAGKAGMLLLFLLAFFVAVNGIFIMCPAEDAVYVLMTYSYTFLIILPICMTDRILGQKGMSVQKLMAGMEYGIVGIATVMVLTYCHFANAQYLSMQLTYEQATSFYTTLITQIKSVEGYSDEMPIMVVESSSHIEDKTLYRNDVMNVFDISGRDEVLAETYSREYFLAYYCGFSPKYISADELPKEIADAMPVYPQEGSIQIIDGAVVIKLNE